MSMIIGRTPFLGRERELGVLKAALEDSASGRGRLVMIAGEPGIGKTRTAQELALIAESRGAQTLWGRCHEEQGAPPYWPWLQVIRAYIHQHEADQLRLAMGAGAADIAGVVPDLREKLPDLKLPPAPTADTEPAQARFRLFDSITSFLKNASSSSSGQLLVIILDNLHWADRSSLLLLEFLAQEIEKSRLMVVGTYRDTDVPRRHALAQTLGELAKQQPFRRVFLRGLSHEDVGRLIELTAGFRPSEAFISAVHTQTEGNPFFVTEVARLLEADAGARYVVPLQPATQVMPIPEGVREAIGRRLSRLSDPCTQALTVASVIGREFDFRLLAAVGADIAESQLLDALDEALESHVIVGAHRDAPYAGTERYQFSHSLIRQTLYDQLSASRRVRLHARVGEAIEGLYGDDVAGHASDLTYHFAEAAPVVGSEKLVRYSIMAGEQALATYAYDEALAHFERGLAAKIGRATDDETAEMLFGLGRAQAATMGLPQLQDAIATLSRAFEYYAESGNARKAVAIAEYTVTLFPGTTSMTQLIARALALAPPDSHEAGRLLTRYVRALGSEEGDYAGAKSAYSRALTIARREKDTALELRALVEMATVDFYQVRFRESMEKSQQAVELAQSLDDPRTEVLARHLAGQSPLHIAEPERARAHIAACLAAADRMRDRVGLTFALVSGMTLNSLEGDWKAARDLSDRSLALAPQDELFLWFRLLLEHQIGEFDQGKAYFERSLEMFQSAAPQPSIYYACTTLGIPLVARATGVAEHLDAAQKAARAILASPRVIPSVAWIARLALGLIAVYYGDAAEAEKQYITLEPHRGTILAMPSTDRVLGLLAGTMGKLDNAMAHFEDALAFCRKAGYRPELAWTCYDYADLLIGTRDVVPLRAAADKALALLDEALAITTELGMRPLKEKVITIQKQIESQPPRDDLGIAHAYPDGLTQREVEVLRLIAAGKSNREIAGELFIAVNTVQRHVQNILNKTRTTNRTEAAVYASRQGLVS